MKTALTIAGSDSSGGAGIQADIKTMTANGVYAMSAITALTAQNTTGVFAVQVTETQNLEKQIEAVATDIFPDAVKIGMIPTETQAESVKNSIIKFKFQNIVLDPVMISTSGTKLISDNAISKIQEELFPLSTLITPNIPEAEFILSKKIDSETEMEKSAKEIAIQFGCSVLLKGGHKTGSADDFLFCKNGFSKWFRGERVKNPNTHGTGCTLSSAIASNLAKGFSLEESIFRAKEYVTKTIKAMLDLGKGSGPLMHNFIFANQNSQIKNQEQ